MRIPRLPRLATFLTAVLFVATGTASADVVLNAGGQARLRVSWKPAKNEQLKASAAVLAEYLGRISGVPFTLVPDHEDDAILLCLHEDVSDADRAKLSSMGPEAHMIRTDQGRVVLAGNSEKAVQNACYELLERLGCRWLAPGKRWTVIPRRAELSVPEMVVFNEPDWAFRRIWYAYGMGVDHSRQVLGRDYKRWFDANRLGGVAAYRCGHTYPSTVRKHAEEFKKHPEYFAMTEDGNRLPFHTHQSLCYSNPRLAELFIADKVAELRADKARNPYAYTVSMDPNDSSKPCYCQRCKALGNGSDQCLYLANHVARALRKVFPDAVVTFYVYASHRLPPENVKAEPNINVQVAMAFNRTKYSLPELVQLWRERVKAIGIRDYLGVMAWDWGLPGRGRASSFEYVKEAIPKYKRWGATSYNAEINANWGTFGPATYVATKLLWDGDTDAQAAYDDFFTHAYGTADEEMKTLYAMWAKSTTLSPRNLCLWFQQLAKAFAAARDEGSDVQARLVDIAGYLHYARLFSKWEIALKTKDRARAYAALLPMLQFTWRIRERQVVHAYALQRRLVNSGHPAIRPLKPRWRFNDPDAVWKHPEPLDDAELLALFRSDLAAAAAEAEKAD